VLNKLKRLLKKILMIEEEFLCDTCRYDYPNACTNRERPNATACVDYKKR
jgi:hypothetical protein